MVIVTAHRGVTFLHGVIALFDRGTRNTHKVVVMREFVFDTARAACRFKVTKRSSLAGVGIYFLCRNGTSDDGALCDDGW